MQASENHNILTQLRSGLNTTNFVRAIRDLHHGLLRWPLWMMLGSQEIRQRYRRSKLGPFWLTISLGVTVAALGFLYGSLFKQPLTDYLPYLAAGFVVWGLISGLINDGARAFIDSEGLIRQLSAPLSIYVYRTLWTGLLTFLHNVVVFFVVALIFLRWPGWPLILLGPAIILLLLNGAWMILFIGVISARFRDVPQIIASIVQVMFFITPILWTTDMLPDRALFLELNPFFHFVEIIRSPMLGEWPSVETWMAVIAITLVGWSLALVAYTVYRWRIAYWL
ncbi:ABC transporter permease [Lamprobacter modestohalophilus]|uniref:Transport permease protein n=2 Tax=Lamprobacter modestohalophilus TaxID=1064514 RepID=A0A9X0W6L7_9GAMM|nr:ABC transporter permease [Lamprobacter modestohalophilus]MCF7977119.1 ABC transporter permease [Chromatiaceae bacterium]MCF7994283.1 ABC transporter permease [Chromatiaceae bacterium]MCF8015593.1 ABC transporter permease [Chromatiaceae bacterium]